MQCNQDRAAKLEEIFYSLQNDLSTDGYDLLSTLEPFGEIPALVAPKFPACSLLDRDKVAEELQSWIDRANELVSKHQQEVDEWSRKHEEEKDSAIAAFEAFIKKYQSAIGHLKAEQDKCREEATKAIQNAKQELDRWVRTQQKSIAEAQMTIHALKLEVPRISPWLQKRDPPEELLYPITHEIMRHPVVALDGHTYERSAIEKFWTDKGSPISPVTNLRLVSDRLTPNVALRSLCSMFDDENESVESGMTVL